MSTEDHDLNSLQTLDALLSYQHVSNAAQVLYKTQPAVSATLTKLRRYFDDELLVPDPDGSQQLVLTTFARGLAPLVANAVAAGRQVFAHRLHFDPLTDERVFSVLASDYVCHVLLRPVIRALPDIAPNVTVDVRPVLPGYDKKLRAGLVDVLILPSALDALEAFPKETLFTDEFVLAMDRHNPVAQQPLTVEEFRRLPQFGYETATVDLPSLPGQELQRHGAEGRLTATVTSFLAIPPMLAESSLVSVMHSRLATLFPELTHIPIPFATDKISEAMHWSPRHETDPAHFWLRSLLRDAAANLPELPV